MYWKQVDNRRWNLTQTSSAWWLNGEILGYIVKTKNKRNCRNWRVYRWDDDACRGVFLTQFQNMKREEIQDIAKVLIGAQA